MKKDLAIFTICKNEPTFLPIWLSYYYQFTDNLYVLDHQSDDGSTDGVRGYAQHIIVQNELAFDHRWITDTVMSFQKKLLEEYRVVLFTEIDEIIWHKDGLDEYAANFNKPSVKCNGFDLIHMPDEPEIDMSRPILEQRKYWFHSPTFQCKPNIATVPLNYCYGYHGADGITEIDPDLYHIHLNRFDYSKSYERNLSRQKFKMHEGDKVAGFGFQKHLQGEEFTNWFYNFRQESPIVEIPQFIIEANIV